MRNLKLYQTPAERNLAATPAMGHLPPPQAAGHRLHKTSAEQKAHCSVMVGHGRCTSCFPHHPHGM